MQIITIGKRLVPAEQIALVEPFDPASNPEFKPEKTYLDYGWKSCVPSNGKMFRSTNAVWTYQSSFGRRTMRPGQLSCRFGCVCISNSLHPR
jgi:hypothetical protein